MSDSKTHTITLKGEQNGEPWLVLGAASLDELEASLCQSFPELDPSLELPELIWRAQAMWAATRALVVGGLVGASEAPPGGVSPQYTPPQNGQQGAAQGASGGNGPAPACQHGPRQWVDPQGKPWKGWFCPLPQGAQGKCKPQFVN